MKIKNKISDILFRPSKNFVGIEITLEIGKKTKNKNIPVLSNISHG